MLAQLQLGCPANEGILRASEISRDRVEDVSSLFKVGDEVEAKFIGIDRKKRNISLSIKAKEYDEEAEVLEGYSNQAGGSNVMHDQLKDLKQQIGGESEE